MPDNSKELSTKDINISNLKSSLDENHNEKLKLADLMKSIVTNKSNNHKEVPMDLVPLKPVGTVNGIPWVTRMEERVAKINVLEDL